MLDNPYSYARILKEWWINENDPWPTNYSAIFSCTSSLSLSLLFFNAQFCWFSLFNAFFHVYMRSSNFSTNCFSHCKWIAYTKIPCLGNRKWSNKFWYDKTGCDNSHFARIVWVKLRSRANSMTAGCSLSFCWSLASHMEFLTRSETLIAKSPSP